MPPRQLASGLHLCRGCVYSINRPEHLFLTVSGSGLAARPQLAALAGGLVRRGSCARPNLRVARPISGFPPSFSRFAVSQLGNRDVSVITSFFVCTWTSSSPAYCQAPAARAISLAWLACPPSPKPLFFPRLLTFVISPRHVANSRAPLPPPASPSGEAHVFVCLRPPQRRNGLLLDAPVLSRLSHKRLMAAFQVAAQRGEQDLYRCVTLSPRGAAVSNFGELIVRGKLTPRFTAHWAYGASTQHTGANTQLPDG